MEASIPVKNVTFDKSGNTVTMIFNGNTDLRDDFLETITNYMFSMNEQNDFVRFIFEIVKNIYDHAGGLGKFTYTKIGNIIEFEIGDTNTEPINNFDELKKLGFSTKSTERDSPNRGKGLSIIESCGNDSFYCSEFSIDTTAGITYKGKWKIRNNI